MLTITKKVTKRKMSLEDFMKLKEDDPFEGYRQMAKAVNFGFLFGLVAASFAVKTLETSWTEERADQHIKDNNLRELKEKIINKFPRATPKMWKMITCATDIRTKFFSTYRGLQERISRERAFAQEYGYVRSWHGAIRRTPEFFFMHKNDKGRVASDDEKLYSGMMGTLLNVAANTTIQNFEAVVVMNSIQEINQWLKDNNMKSYIWGSVHDSIDMCIHRDEVAVVCNKLNEICARSYPEYLGMPLAVDIKLADLNKGEMYKGGRKLKSFLSTLEPR